MFPSTKRFTERRRLGEGGMGVVYEAFDVERRAAVALKTLNRVDSEAITRFKREFRALQDLSHPNLVAFDELFFENGQWFFTMELLDGHDFVNHVRKVAAPTVYASTVRHAAGFPISGEVPIYEAAEIAASFDEPRLRDALRQLLEALVVLHAADKVHRDVKPPNVLVTKEDRVVLLDFGLVADDSQEERMGPLLVGTPEYMAPEQAAMRGAAPPADLYAVGVMLFEALTGRLPFRGSALQIILDKQNRDAPSPSSVTTNLPPDLDALCTKLLRFDALARPTAAMALDALNTPSKRRSIPNSSSAPAFVGRREEIAQLRAAFETARAGELATVLVCGESGIGKTCLVRQFVRELADANADLVLLEGRCYEREAMPYKALDGIVDALGRRLATMPADDVEAVVPTAAAALAQLFPVMLRVPLVAGAHAASTASTDPPELRQQAFNALRTLFQRLARRRPTLVVIDDLQWADQDGLRALGDILARPGAPPLLLIGTVRMHLDTKPPGFERLRAVLPGDTQTIELSNLGHSDARQLAATILDRGGPTGEADPDTVANEAGGHPLFIEELARHVALGGSARDDVRLDDAIWSRVSQLEPRTREVAELVAVAGKPLPQKVVASAAHLAPAVFSRSAGALRVGNLVRTGGASWVDTIEPYHDRVREAVLAQLTPQRRITLHEALAIAFEASSHNDPETLALHWREAGKMSLAARYAAAAGDEAARAFAFERAAQWFEQALELLPGDHPTRRDLALKLGGALANAGRGAAAATQFEIAAEESPPLEALELRRRAVDQLLRSGHFERGLASSRAVLGAIGMRLPATRFEIILALVFHRIRLAVRGLRFRVREPAEIAAEELTRIDACWSVGMALTFVDTLVGFLFMTRALLLALSTGELDRVARCVGMEIGLVGSAGGPAWRRTERLITYARELADRSGTVQARFFALGPAGGAYFCAGRFVEAADHISRALKLLEDGSLGLVHERVTMRVFLLDTLMNLGRYRDLAHLQREALRDARARGDWYAIVEFTLDIPGQAWLVEDRPDLYEQHTREVMRAWPSTGYHLEHFHELEGRVRLKLYLNEPEEAYALARELAHRTRRSFLWRIQPIRWSCFHLKAIAALAMLQKGVGNREALLRAAAANGKRLGREEMTCSGAFVRMIEAGIALRTGRDAEAIAALETAAREFDGFQMRGYAASVRDRAARLRADAKSADDLSRTADYFKAEGVVAPDRMMNLLAPGLLKAAPAPTVTP